MRPIASVVFALLCLGLWNGTLYGQDTLSRFDIGAQYTLFHLQHSFNGTNNLLGVRASLNANRHITIDGQLDFGLKDYDVTRSGTIDGGRIIVGRFGIRAGSRTKRFGFFGQARPGFVTESKAITAINFQPMQQFVRFGRLTNPALNVGAVLEYYPARHLGARLDVGDTLICYPDRNVVVGGPTLKSFTSNNLDVSIGFFYRF